MKRRALWLLGACLAVGFVGFAGLWLAKLLPDLSGEQRPPVSSADPERYSFFVAGHVYGTPGVNNPGVHPPFKARFPEINSQGTDLGFWTGDTVITSTPTDWDEIDADLAAITAPTHLIVGNHDMTNRELFVSRYGPTYYSFEHQGDLFIALDSELDPSNISGEQMTFLRDAVRSTTAQNIFILVHRLLWVSEGTPYYKLKSGLNSAKGYNFRANFWTEVEPLLRTLDAQVYVIAGDVGVTWAMSLFYEHYDNMHLVASGMGGSEEENYLIFTVGPDGVQVQAQRLDGQPLNRGAVTAYNLAAYGQQ